MIYNIVNQLIIVENIYNNKINFMMLPLQMDHHTFRLLLRNNWKILEEEGKRLLKSIWILINSLYFMVVCLTLIKLHKLGWRNRGIVIFKHRFWRLKRRQVRVEFQLSLQARLLKTLLSTSVMTYPISLTSQSSYKPVSNSSVTHFALTSSTTNLKNNTNYSSFVSAYYS